ncbi:hypothetical protein PHJA_002416600 [Phtheirospermum japonicum]|uniref:Uncharacterized protein n=1 Tax=Phtheirospermum japonicum TaxID=374723 RepID=A0A830CUA3_9LAMI|nr:hypothetical protein PHJA_002416600 [Phtheirospermum japonicum]
MAAAPPSLLLLSLLLLSSPLSHAFFFSNYQNLFSLSHSLISRVATLRASRGDLSGAARARTLARTLERVTGLGFYKFAWNVGWDYMKNYAWRDTLSFQTLGGVMSDLSELSGALFELSRIQSDAERMAWVGRNYKKALRVSKSILNRLLTVFRQPGPLREVVVALQKEITEGDLLRDCLELGSDDLKGLVQLLKNIALQYSSASPNTDL